MTKQWYTSKTIHFFATVLALGGLDMIESLVNQASIGWREVALTVIGLVGIGLRLVTNKGVTK